MYKLLLIIGFVVLTSFGASTRITGSHDPFAESDSLQVLKPSQKHVYQANFITKYLTQAHYRKLPLNDSVSSVIFTNYFNSIDPGRAYFFTSDIAQFEDLRYQLDNQIPTGQLNFAYDVFDIYRNRALERIDYVFNLLETEFDFFKDESYIYNREDEARPSTKEEQNEIWRKIIKNQALSYKLVGKEWDDIAESLTKRYKRIQKAIYQYNSEDVFQSYMNALSNVYDPHTDYFSPPDAKNFQIDMSLSLEGIGARLMQNLDYTEVADIIPGGPAYKSKLLQKDDRIIGVAQDEDGEFEDVIGWRLDDVVAKIRGPKGSVVRLQILKASEGQNTLPDTIRLERDKIKLESQAAKSEIIPITEGTVTYKLGVITVPSFYLDFEAFNSGQKDYRSTTRDVKKLITELNEQGMDGLLIDLRYNGGGSLTEAIEMTGLFIPQGPVVQVKNFNEKIEKYEDTDNGEVFYNGPLSVMVNWASASASEIFSGAIQDYKRGVIIGESTFGKGTVQNIIDLQERHGASFPVDIKSEQIGADQNLGQIKMTIAKFYRVTGSSNQRIGISPDILLPSVYSLDEVGEASRPNALPWDEISDAGFEPTDNVSEELLDRLNELYISHLGSDPDLQKLVKDIERAKKDRERTQVSLNLEIRRSNQNADSDLSTTISDEESLTGENEIEKKLSQDPYLKEGLRLLAEITRRKTG